MECCYRGHDFRDSLFAAASGRMRTHDVLSGESSSEEGEQLEKNREIGEARRSRQTHFARTGVSCSKLGRMGRMGRMGPIRPIRPIRPIVEQANKQSEPELE